MGASPFQLRRKIDRARAECDGRRRLTKRIRRPTEASRGKRCDTGKSQEGMRCLYPDSRAAPGWKIWEWDALRTPSSSTAVTKPQGARIQLIENWMMGRFVLQLPHGSQMSLQTASVSMQLLDDHVLFNRHPLHFVGGVRSHGLLVIVYRLPTKTSHVGGDVASRMMLTVVIVLQAVLQHGACCFDLVLHRAWWNFSRTMG